MRSKQITDKYKEIHIEIHTAIVDNISAMCLLLHTNVYIYIYNILLLLLDTKQPTINQIKTINRFVLHTVKLSKLNFLTYF